MEVECSVEVEFCVELQICVKGEFCVEVSFFLDLCYAFLCPTQPKDKNDDITISLLTLLELISLSVNTAYVQGKLSKRYMLGNCLPI